MLQFVKSSVGGRQVSKVNSSDKNKIIEEEDEEKAYDKIGEEFGIEPVRIILALKRYGIYKDGIRHRYSSGRIRLYT